MSELGCLEYAQKKIKQFSDLAKKELSKFENSVFKDSLLLAIDFNVDRKF